MAGGAASCRAVSAWRRGAEGGKRWRQAKVAAPGRDAPWIDLGGGGKKGGNTIKQKNTKKHKKTQIRKRKAGKRGKRKQTRRGDTKGTNFHEPKHSTPKGWMGAGQGRSRQVKAGQGRSRHFLNFVSRRSAILRSTARNELDKEVLSVVLSTRSRTK